MRHRGTLGGSIAHGDPASDLPAVLLALDATVRCAGPAGERTIAAADFFVDFLETALAPDELLTEIRVPKSGAAGFNYQKFNRRAQDWAIVGALAVRQRHDAGRARQHGQHARCARSAVEDALAAGASITDAAEHAADGSEPPTDLNASPEFREHLARVCSCAERSRPPPERSSRPRGVDPKSCCGLRVSSRVSCTGTVD